MQPLATIKWAMTWICMYPTSQSSSLQQKILHNVFGLVFFAISVLGVAICMAFIWKFVAVDLIASLFAFLGVALYCQSLYTMPIGYVLRYRARSIFDELSKIYDTYKNADGMEFCYRVNNICEWIWPLTFKLVVAFNVSDYLMSTATVIYCRSIFGYIKSDHVLHSLNVVLPWNQTSLYGYYGEVITITSVGNVYGAIIFTLSLFFVSICLHHEAFYKMVKLWIDDWNGHEGNRASRCSDEQFICDLIRFHVTVKDWFMDTVSFYSPFVLVQLISCVLILATSIFQFDLQLRTRIDYTLLILFMTTSTGMMVLLLYCYFGHLAIESMDKMSDCVFELNWHKLTHKLQKYIVVMIANMQTPLYYHGFKVAILDLNTFLRLIKTVLSYFMIFKTLASE